MNEVSPTRPWRGLASQVNEGRTKMMGQGRAGSWHGLKHKGRRKSPTVVGGLSEQGDRGVALGAGGASSHEGEARREDGDGGAVQHEGKSGELPPRAMRQGQPMACLAA
ncbi:hypothetical protein L7F22_038757 [Adiantum nelumboides]|nr:hypothetical protein [Adiantum nelumboides]